MKKKINILQITKDIFDECRLKKYPEWDEELRKILDTSLDPLK